MKGREESGWCQAGEDEIKIWGCGEAQVSLPGSLGLSQPFGEGEEEDGWRNDSLIPAMLTGLHSGMPQAGTSPELSRICLPFMLIPPNHSNKSRIRNKALSSKNRAWHERCAANGALGISPSPPPSREMRGAVKQRCNSSTCFKTSIS